jgi:integrase
MIKVTLRKKSISGNRQSLYLDFYPAVINQTTGKASRREFLGLYVIDKPKGVLEKSDNEKSIRLANQILSNRKNELNKPEVYSEFELKQLKIKENGNRDFMEYFRTTADKRKESNHDTWICTLNYLERFTGGSLKFSELSEKWCEDFKHYLLTTKSVKSKQQTLSTNSALSYFNKLKATLKQAFKDGILETDLNAKVERIKEAETHRSFLSLDELNELVKTDCPNPLIKRAALFSALTGLRFSDIEKLVWGEIIRSNESEYFIKFRQKKTKGTEYLPISDQAIQLMGDWGPDEKKIFDGLSYSAYQNKHLHQWLGAARITKDITFHSFRHTYATLQLSSGTDIYTVSKMLGHRDLKTTQIYAKIVDETKRKAVNAIKLNMP